MEARVKVLLNGNHEVEATLDQNNPLTIESTDSETFFRFQLVESREHHLTVAIFQVFSDQNGTTSEVVETVDIGQEYSLASDAFTLPVQVMLVQKSTSSQMVPLECCRTCNGWKSCGCKVESCLGCCCAVGCCPCP